MIEPQPPLARTLTAEDHESPRPVVVVWELTMKCDQPCAHCGSRAGHARRSELSTEEALDVGRRLIRMGAREIALIGGEAYLRPDLYEIIACLAGEGARVSMQTGGRALTAERARALKEAGLSSLGVSIDGPARIHDRLRGNLGSHAAALAALDNARAAGLVTSSNTQINRLNAPFLRDHARTLRAHGIQAWQTQITVPMGRAVEHPEWLLEPYQIVEVIDTLAAIQREALEEYQGGIPFNVIAGNNIGYFGPHEQLLRSRPGGTETHWRGCLAGQVTIGIESDGSVKACPSLPTAPYVGGNLRDAPIEEIWASSPEVRFTRDRTRGELWGHCATCYYADECRGGCSWTAHVTLGRRGNNPFCYHRVIQLRRKGVRERLVKVEAAPQQPYDFGRFEIVEEPIPAEGGA